MLSHCPMLNPAYLISSLKKSNTILPKPNKKTKFQNIFSLKGNFTGKAGNFQRVK